jgi:hypothetical protein
VAYWQVVPRAVPTATSQLVTVLTPGEHHFDVVPVSDAGVGSPSDVISVTVGPPAAPDAHATPSDRRITVTWSAPAPSGSPVLGYVVERAKGAGPWKTMQQPGPSATTYTSRNLTNGQQYRYRVAARTALGLGAWAEVSAVPSAPPSSPRSLRVTRAPGQVTLTWRVPSSTHGAPVTDYVVQLSINGKTWTTVPDGVSTSPQAVVAGLSIGTKYRVRVRAVNAAGTGTASSTVTFVLRS